MRRRAVRDANGHVVADEKPGSALAHGHALTIARLEAENQRLTAENTALEAEVALLDGELLKIEREAV
jgi:hypothetical protein